MDQNAYNLPHNILCISKMSLPHILLSKCLCKYVYIQILTNKAWYLLLLILHDFSIVHNYDKKKLQERNCINEYLICVITNGFIIDTFLFLSLKKI